MDESFEMLLERSKQLVKRSRTWDIIPCKLGLMSVFIAGEHEDTREPFFGAKRLTTFEDLLLDVFMEVEVVVRFSFRNGNYSHKDFLSTFNTFAMHYIKGLPREEEAKAALIAYTLTNLFNT